jgi:DNA-binding transcriptional ArsR family regulator
MDTEEQFGQMAALLGEPARARILWTLLEGKALTATELALRADISPQSASMHLARLIRAGWLQVEHQGRHRYYQLASREVAYAIEALANLLPAEKRDPAIPPPSNGDIKFCRSCYDHLAGRTGVAVTDALLKKGLLQQVTIRNSSSAGHGPSSGKSAGVPANSSYSLTAAGTKWFASLGIDTQQLRQQRRSFARPCLDWSERRHHLAGSLGAALLDKWLSEDWLRRVRHSRIMIITAKGAKKLDQLLGLNIC